ncbi:hypothetical protein CCACVL1_04178 [Corchorus capsularis]|uniref:Uncharacterized protein n=1 Tax=Corchorus capsularis TaxID=210143 RepID=A0A1R3JUR7_COCAP|nr:hypothetical protein CCACVL1_04178 [Corchorus capsularis]
MWGLDLQLLSFNGGGLSLRYGGPVVVRSSVGGG